MTFTIENEEQTIAFLKECAEAYYNTGEPIISDAEYDELYLLASKAFPDNDFFSRIGAPVRGAEVGHTTQIGGLEQVHAGEWAKWLIRSGHNDEDLVISEKLDGSSLTLKFQDNGRLKSGYTRGDGITGKDVTRHVKKMACVPKKVQGALEVRGEFIIKKENFEAVKEVLFRLTGKEYKNLRGIANGLINNKEIPDEVMPYLDFVAYGVNLPLSQKMVFHFLKQCGFLTPHHIVLSHLNVGDERVLNNILDIMRNDSLYEIDGIVVEYNEVEKRQSLGVHETSANPKYAFKWKTRSVDNIATVTVTGVEWNISKHHYWKPTVLIEPVDLVGITIKRLSGFNAKFIKDNGIGAGATMTITRAGDVIPHILEVNTPAADWDRPPGAWDWNETEVDAVSTEINDDVHLLKMKHFFNTLEVDGVQEATLQMLIDEGYDSIVKIIDMTRPEWFEVVGRNGEKSYDSLHAKLQDVYLWELMAAWPMFGRGFGRRKAKALTEAFGLNIFTLTEADIATIDGFSVKSAEAVLEGLETFKEFYDYIHHEGFTKLKQDDTMTHTGKLSGVNFVFTGFRDKDAQAKIEEQGGTVQDGIKDDTTYLVMKDTRKVTNKTKAAQAKGVKIITIAEMQEIVG